MNVSEQIKKYIESLSETKGGEMQVLHQLILEIFPSDKLWFLDGKDDAGKTVSNPNVGYGQRTIKYTDGKTKDFYQIGISANTSGISVYILGIEDKRCLADKFAKELGKASVSGYCIKFKTLKDINIDILKEAIVYSVNQG